jgi:antitoxin ParD1/3/4
VVSSWQEKRLDKFARICIRDFMAQINVSLPPALKSWIDARVSEGRHSSPSDYLRDLIRRDQDKATDDAAWLQQMLDEGEASGVCEGDAFQILGEVIAQHRVKLDRAA